MTRDADCCVFLEADRGLFLISVVEDDRDAGLGDTCLTAFVDKILRMIELARKKGMAISFIRDSFLTTKF